MRKVAKRERDWREYLFFLMSVAGLLLLRNRDDPRAAPQYMTWVGNQVIFSIVSSFLILRGVLTEPLQGFAILLVGLFGLGMFLLEIKGAPFPAGRYGLRFIIPRTGRISGGTTRAS